MMTAHNVIDFQEHVRLREIVRRVLAISARVDTAIDLVDLACAGVRAVAACAEFNARVGEQNRLARFVIECSEAAA
jgi:hypothetical protein